MASMLVTMRATLSGVIVTATSAVFPSQRAVSVTVAVRWAVTLAVWRPVGVSGAAIGSVDSQLHTRSVKGFPAASFGDATSAYVSPSSSDSWLTLAVTLAIGIRETVIWAYPFFPSDVAVIVTGPSPFASTKPVPLTVANASSLLVHCTARSASGRPSDASGSASSSTLWPTKRDCWFGGTRTDATTTGPVGAVELESPQAAARRIRCAAAAAALRERECIAEVS